MRAREIIRNIAESRGSSFEEITGPSRKQSLMPKRKGIARALKDAGFKQSVIAREMRKSQSTILYYLSPVFERAQKAAANRRNAEARAA